MIILAESSGKYRNGGIVIDDDEINIENDIEENREIVQSPNKINIKNGNIATQKCLKCHSCSSYNSNVNDTGDNNVDNNCKALANKKLIVVNIKNIT